MQGVLHLQQESEKVSEPSRQEGEKAQSKTNENDGEEKKLEEQKAVLN